MSDFDSIDDPQLEGLADLIDAQIATDGVSAIKVKDGHVFTFTTEILDYLKAAVNESGRVVVFVRAQVLQ